jgi:hypothetical protein
MHTHYLQIIFNLEPHDNRIVRRLAKRSLSACIYPPATNRQPLTASR